MDIKEKLKMSVCTVHYICKSIVAFPLGPRWGKFPSKIIHCVGCGLILLGLFTIQASNEAIHPVNQFLINFYFFQLCDFVIIQKYLTARYQVTRRQVFVQLFVSSTGDVSTVFRVSSSTPSPRSLIAPVTFQQSCLLGITDMEKMSESRFLVHTKINKSADTSLRGVWV